jgi:hypothetical protein
MAAMEQFETEATRVVLGRPVRFSGVETEQDEALALERLRTAATLAGFQQISFEFEPVAAAYQYETQLDPVVRRFFSKTFGAEKLRSGEELTTVAKGLALRALEES